MNFQVGIDNMIANFKKTNIEVKFGEFRELDIATQLGNYIHSNTTDIGLDDVARKIYYSEGEIEISAEHAAVIKELMNEDQCPFLAFVKQAVIKQLTE